MRGSSGRRRAPASCFVAVFVVAYLTRAQAVALLPAVLTAPLLVAGSSVRPRLLVRYRALYVTLAGALLLAVAYEGVRGRSPLGVLGAYRGDRQQGYSVGEVGRWFLYHVAELDLYVGVVPFAALLLLAVALARLAAAQRCSSPRRSRSRSGSCSRSPRSRRG